MIQRSEEIWPRSLNQWLSVTIDRAPTAPKATIILCHGLTGDKIGPQKLLANLSFHLACGEADVVRFDFRGSGFSSGSFLTTSLNSMLEDALWVAGRKKHNIFWMGISTGALIALMAAAHRNKNEPVVAISNGLAESIAFDPMQEDPVSLHGGQLQLNKQYFESRATLRPRSCFFNKLTDISVILGSKDEKHYRERQSLIDAGIRVHTIQDSDHLFTAPQHRKELFNYIEKRVFKRSTQT